jgi:hypothetical protein
MRLIASHSGLDGTYRVYAQDRYSLRWGPARVGLYISAGVCTSIAQEDVTTLHDWCLHAWLRCEVQRVLV